MSDQRESDGPVMPFVVVESKGGPYPDEAYRVGYEAGVLDETLRIMVLLEGDRVGPRLIHAANLPQLDLVAMRHGFTISVEHESDEWRVVWFNRDLQEMWEV